MECLPHTWICGCQVRSIDSRIFAAERTDYLPHYFHYSLRNWVLMTNLNLNLKSSSFLINHPPVTHHPLLAPEITTWYFYCLCWRTVCCGIERRRIFALSRGSFGTTPPAWCNSSDSHHICSLVIRTEFYSLSVVSGLLLSVGVADDPRQKPLFWRKRSPWLPIYSALGRLRRW